MTVYNRSRSAVTNSLTQASDYAVEVAATVDGDSVAGRFGLLWIADRRVGSVDRRRTLISVAVALSDRRLPALFPAS